jgi:hypothetical protein
MSPAKRSDSREAKLAQAAEQRGWKLDKVGRRYKLVAENGTIVADDWATGEGLTLDDIEAALER